MSARLWVVNGSRYLFTVPIMALSASVTDMCCIATLSSYEIASLSDRSTSTALWSIWYDYSGRIPEILVIHAL